MNESQMKGKTSIPPPLKLLLVSPLPPPASGIASWTVRVLKEMSERDDMEICHVDTAVRWRSTNDNRWGVRLLGGSAQALRDTLRIFSAMRRFRPDVIHLCTSGSLSIPKDILILLLARALRVPCVLHYRKGDLPEIMTESGLEWHMMQWAMKLADTVLLLDRKSETALAKTFPRSCIQRIPNPIDIEEIESTIGKNPAHQSGKVMTVLFAGWVVPTKGVCELVEACLAIEGVQFELGLVGPVLGELRSKLETVASKREEGKWLKIHGHACWEDTIHLINASYMFVLPSYSEGFPNVILEAMALGKPIVATRVGAIPEMLGDDALYPCGMLVPPQSIDQLRDSILYLLQHPGEACAFGTQARERASSHYDIAKVFDKYLQLWCALGR